MRESIQDHVSDESVVEQVGGVPRMDPRMNQGGEDVDLVAQVYEKVKTLMSVYGDRVVLDAIRDMAIKRSEEWGEFAARMTKMPCP